MMMTKWNLCNLLHNMDPADTFTFDINTTDSEGNTVQLLTDSFFKVKIYSKYMKEKGNSVALQS